MEETIPALAEVEKNIKSAMVDKEQTPLFEEDLTETKPVYPEFTLIIRDLERKKDVEKAREVLSDPKFEFNLEDIESQIQKGHITISSLSEAQGTLIVQKLKDIQADIRFDLSLKILPKFENVIPSHLPEPPGNLADLKKKLSKQFDPHFIVSTSSQLPHTKIKKYLGIVTAEKILSEKQKTDDAIDPLIHELILKAKNKGATAVVGVNFDFKPYPGDKKLAFASATAVIIEDETK